MKKTISIAGFDPSGWAGAIADAETFRAFGVMGFSVLTAITAQDLRAVRAVTPLTPLVVRRQLKTLLEDPGIDAVKIGMLATEENVRLVARLLRKRGITRIVLDPVLRSSSGYPLLEKKGLSPLVTELIPLSAIVTPNIEEASLISGVRIKGVRTMEEAARRIYKLGAASVLVKGGHLKGAPVDCLYDGKVFYRFSGRRLKGRASAFHGTGCILSSATAAGLAKGRTIKKAVEDAKRYLEGVLVERLKRLK